jgi:hypothetical protein
MVQVRPNFVQSVSGDYEVGDATLDHLSQAEMSTIWFALYKQKDVLEADLMKAIKGKGGYTIEDETFLAGELGKVTAMMFAIRYDFDIVGSNKADSVAYINWLSV